MTENVEITKAPKPFDSYKELEVRDYRTYAALGYQALAMSANNATLADSYFGHAMGALVAEDELPKEEGAMPLHTDVYTRAMLNLAPITRELVVKRRISEPETVKEATSHFVHDLGKQARTARKFIKGPTPEDPLILRQQHELIAALNTMSVLGVLLRQQTDLMKTNQWTASLAFLEPESMHYEGKTVYIENMWHINIYQGQSNSDFERLYKVYVRYSRGSQHESFEDKDVSVVWVSQDLWIPGDKRNAVELDVIADLDSNTKSRGKKLDERSWRLLQAIDDRTIGSLTSQH